MNKRELFLKEIDDRVAGYQNNQSLSSASKIFFDEIGYDKAKYVYNFLWMGIPVIQLPQDLQIKQELIWSIRPDVIIETGVAWGGSLIFYASLMSAMIECELIKNPRIIGVEVNMSTEKMETLSAHPLYKKYCEILHGSSTDPVIIKLIAEKIKPSDRVMVILDSNHTHQHVLNELESYCKFVSNNSCFIVEDTTIEWHKASSSIRSWGPGNSPYSAIEEFLKSNSGSEFKLEKMWTDKAVISGMKNGVLRRELGS
jgi:cephalosporin hydroxylase